MKRILIYGFSGLTALIAAILIAASFQPKDWKIEKSVLINAPRDQVWIIVSDLNRYNEWNPFYLIEPEAKTKAEGPAATEGSRYSWDGEKSGAGSMTTTTLVPNERMDFRIDFLRPMEVTNAGSFALSDVEGATKMTWSMSGRHEGFPGLISRSIHLFISMESMMDEHFQNGLNRLKEISEKARV